MDETTAFSEIMDISSISEDNTFDSEYFPSKRRFTFSDSQQDHTFREEFNVDQQPERPSTSIGICETNLDSAFTARFIPASKYFKLETRLKSKTKQIINLKKQLNRKMEKISSITEILKKLKNERLVDEECEKVLKYSAKEVPVALFKRYASNESLDQVSRREYSKEIKTFAHTLHFYSPKAYNYVREVFRCALPHQETVRGWYLKVDGTPGFTQQALSAIKMKANSYKQNGKELYVTLMMDEMSIMKKTELVGGRLIGQVDMGIDYSNDCETDAVEALVIMAVGMTEYWKIPIAYFLINGISASLKTEIITMAIEKLAEVGAKVISLTCDGLFSNQTMLKQLGAVLSVDEPKPWFYLKGNLI